MFEFLYTLSSGRYISRQLYKTSLIENFKPKTVNLRIQALGILSIIAWAFGTGWLINAVCCLI